MFPLSKPVNCFSIKDWKTHVLVSDGFSECDKMEKIERLRMTFVANG